jgi:hypothetical protein
VHLGGRQAASREGGGATIGSSTWGKGVPINTADMIERALERAFAKALKRTLQTKAETLFAREFEKIVLAVERLNAAAAPTVPPWRGEKP